jgi:hypothetical protein
MAPGDRAGVLRYYRAFAPITAESIGDAVVLPAIKGDEGADPSTYFARRGCAR